MIHDLRYAIRMLRKSPGFTLVAVMSLAIGTGANTAMFSFVNALLLRPLPVLRPSEVYAVVARTPKDPYVGLSYPDYLDFRDHSKTMQGMVAWTGVRIGFSTSPADLPKVEFASLVSGNFFRAMGVTPVLGRAFRPDEDQVPGRDAVVVLGHDFWREQLGGDVKAIGRTVRLNGVDFTVIGVAPEQFSGLDQYLKSAMFVPVMMAPRLFSDAQGNLLEQRGNHVFVARARLKPGVTQAQAEGELKGIARSLEESFPATNKGQSAALLTELQLRVGVAPSHAGVIPMLMIMTGLLLLLSCFNVANLQLSRARSRTREVAVRLALGAHRLRIVRQLLTESILLGSAGSLCGMWLAWALVVFSRGLTWPADFPLITVSLDSRVLVFSLATGLFSVLLFGLAPAFAGSRVALIPALKAGDAGGDMGNPGAPRLWGRNLLVAGQVAISLTILVAAMMLYRGFHGALSAGAGFRTSRLMMMSFEPTLARYSEAQAQEFFRRLMERVAPASGVKSAALASSVPLATFGNRDSFVPEGYSFPSGQENVHALSTVVDGRFFETMGIPILQGRGFQIADTADAPKVAVVNEVLAQRYWPGQGAASDAVGRRFRLRDSKGPWVVVVGVAKTGKYRMITEPPTDCLYLPWTQHPQQRATLIAHSFSESASLASPLREAVHGIDPNMPIFDVRTMEDFYQLRAVSIPGRILYTVSVMGLTALVLAMVGLYGLVAYSVICRTREFGIRMAIGATSGGVLKMVLRQGMALALTGIGMGAVLSFAAANLVTATFPSTRGDRTALVVVPVLLALVTLLACYVPARRASRIDPMKALRYE